MNISKKSLAMIALVGIIAIGLSGCGTVKKATDDKTTNQDEVTKAPKTSIVASQVLISTRAISGSNETVSANSVVVVYCGLPFSDQTFVGSDVVVGDPYGNSGPFTVDISSCKYDTFYVVATAQGHSMSDPITLVKP